MNLKYLLASALVLGAITGVNASQNLEQATTPPHEDSGKTKPEPKKHGRHGKGKHHKGAHHKGAHHKEGHHEGKHHHDKKHAEKEQHPTSSKKVDEAKSVLHVEPANQAKG